MRIIDHIVAGFLIYLTIFSLVGLPIVGLFVVAVLGLCEEIMWHYVLRKGPGWETAWLTLGALLPFIWGLL